MATTPSVLFVDDESATLKYFKLAFQNKFPVITADNADSGFQILKDGEDEIGVVMSDQRMPGTSGVELLEIARQCRPAAPRILVTAYTQMDLAVKAVNDAKIFAYIEKPWDLTRLENVLTEAIEVYRRQRLCWQAERTAVKLELPGWMIDLPYTAAKRKCLVEFDHAYLTQSLERYHGNISATARSRKISRKTIQRINKRLKIFEAKAGRKPKRRDDE